MISKEQAAAIGDAILRDGRLPSRQPDKDRKEDRTVMRVVFIGMAIGAIAGMAVCQLLTGRFTPGQIIGQGFGGGIGALAGIYLRSKPSKRLKRVFVMVASIFFVIGVLPLIVLFTQHHNS